MKAIGPRQLSNRIASNAASPLRGLSRTVDSHHLAAAVRLSLILLIVHFVCSKALAFDLSPGPTYPTSDPRNLWLFLPIGYVATVLIETPVLLIGLSKQITFKQRLFAGVWLNACSYPIVVLVLPSLFASSPRGLYLLVAETFAPVAECALFWLAIQRHLELGRATKLRNFGVIVLANICSFVIGELLISLGWFGLL